MAYTIHNNCNELKCGDDDKSEIKINPYDNQSFSRKLIDRKNQKVGFFDLGNHILIAGMILLVVFVSMNVD